MKASHIYKQVSAFALNQDKGIWRWWGGLSYKVAASRAPRPSMHGLKLNRGMRHVRLCMG